MTHHCKTAAEGRPQAHIHLAEAHLPLSLHIRNQSNVDAILDSTTDAITEKIIREEDTSAAENIQSDFTTPEHMAAIGPSYHATSGVMLHESEAETDYSGSYDSQSGMPRPHTPDRLYEI